MTENLDSFVTRAFRNENALSSLHLLSLIGYRSIYIYLVCFVIQSTKKLELALERAHNEVCGAH